MEKEFESRVLLPEIERKKKTLEEIRQSRIEPINHSKIKKDRSKHIKQVRLITKNKADERKKTINDHKYNPKQFENYFSKLVRKMEEERQKSDKDKQEGKQKYKNAKSEYSGFSISTLTKMFNNK